MKRIIIVLLGIFVALALGFQIVKTPDSDILEMRDKYGGTLAQYTGSPNELEKTQLNVHYRDQGSPDGQPILFIHGSNASLHTWEDVIARMPQQYRLISLDLPGHGLTGAHPQLDYSITGMFAAIDAVIGKLELERNKLVLVGNSMGGWVSWRYALDNAEHVKAMVLIDAAGAPTTKKPKSNLGFRLMRNPLIRPLTTQITPRWIIKKSLQQTVNEPTIVTEAMVDRYWELLRYPGNRQATMIRSQLPRDISEFGSRISDIETPTLILWGETDSLIDVSSGHVFDKELQNSKLIIYPDIGHIAMEEIPDDVAGDISAFLQNLE